MLKNAWSTGRLSARRRTTPVHTFQLPSEQSLRACVPRVHPSIVLPAVETMRVRTFATILRTARLSSPCLGFHPPKSLSSVPSPGTHGTRQSGQARRVRGGGQRHGKQWSHPDLLDELDLGRKDRPPAVPGKSFAAGDDEQGTSATFRTYRTYESDATDLGRRIIPVCQ